MAWGCFSHKGMEVLINVTGKKINAACYLEILRNDLLQSISRLHSDDEYVLQQDNTPCHKVKLVKIWLEQNSIPVIPD